MSEFKEIYILKILHIINYQLSVSSLLELGLEYSQVAELLSEVIQGGLVEDLEENGLKLTQSGLVVLEDLNKKHYPSNTQSWILPSEEYRIPKIDKFDIYLPKKGYVEE